MILPVHAVRPDTVPLETVLDGGPSRKVPLALPGDVELATLRASPHPFPETLNVASNDTADTDAILSIEASPWRSWGRWATLDTFLQNFVYFLTLGQRSFVGKDKMPDIAWTFGLAHHRTMEIFAAADAQQMGVA